MTLLYALIILLLGMPVTAQAALVEYDLTIALQEVKITGRPVPAMTINGGIPGPVLRFREGDTARIRVHNSMDVETSIHWHGVLVPPGMDGVPFVSFPPIGAGTSFTYEFPVRQSGTYWYHSHTDLQEQSGVYGGIVIDPPTLPSHADRDYVVLLSDWTEEDPHEVLRTLKRGSEWYGIEKGSGQSILGAARRGRLGDYFRRELQRMPAMDISDVAYDRFLANGRPEISLDAEPGETVRLRIIDGSSTTFFYLDFAGGPMTIVSADGQDVEPVRQERFLISVAETYDILVRIPEAGSYELRATAHDGSGHASVWIGAGGPVYAPDVPRPDLYHTMGGVSVKSVFALTPAGAMGMSDHAVEAGMFDRPGMMDMEGMDHGTSDNGGGMSGPAGTGMGDGGHEHGTMEMKGHDGQKGGQDRSGFMSMAAGASSMKDSAVDGMDPRRPWPPYDSLRSLRPTAFPADKAVREIRLTLDGDMERYVWFINNRPLSESDSILVKEGEIVRFIMINRTMMHHPMHLHGHFFRVVNAQGDHSPLKHTVDVAPMSTTVIEFNADESGDWFFHCHLLYHMKSGMARVVHYEDYRPAPEVSAVRSRLYREGWYAWIDADVLSNMTEGVISLSSTRNILAARWEAGWNRVDETGWETVLTYERYINHFFTLFGGAYLAGEGNDRDDPRGIAGLRYLMPLNIDARMWLDTDGGARVALEKEIALTPRLSLTGEVEYDTHDRWEGKAGVTYALSRTLSLAGRWHSEFHWGVGVQVRF